eukprot:617816-Rhodomonas_salina.1
MAVTSTMKRRLTFRHLQPPCRNLIAVSPLSAADSTHEIRGTAGGSTLHDTELPDRKHNIPGSLEHALGRRAHQVVQVSTHAISEEAVNMLQPF